MRRAGDDSPGRGRWRSCRACPPPGPVADHSPFLWRDLPGAADPAAALAPEALAVQRLHASGAFAVPLAAPGFGTLTLLVGHATPPVFDGPEDRNGRRNRDEALFWAHLIDGALPGLSRPEGAFVLMANLNLDPADGEGRRDALARLLSHPALADPRPRSDGGAAAAAAQGGANARHAGDPALDTADFADDPGPGNLRVDYILPSAGLRVTGAGVPVAPAGRAAGRRRRGPPRATGWSGWTSPRLTPPRPVALTPRGPRARRGASQRPGNPPCPTLRS